MTPNEYQQYALRTAAVPSSDKKEVLGSYWPAIIGLLQIAKNLESRADLIKKDVFYGKKSPKDVAAFPNSKQIPDQHMDILHAVLGLVTELGEIIEGLHSGIPPKKETPLIAPDESNLREELGDLLWYIALLADALDTNLETEMQKNIEKLRVRYPVKFTDFHATTRDLDREQSIFRSTER